MALQVLTVEYCKLDMKKDGSHTLTHELLFPLFANFKDTVGVRYLISSCTGRILSSTCKHDFEITLILQWQVQEQVLPLYSAARGKIFGKA